MNIPKEQLEAWVASIISSNPTMLDDRDAIVGLLSEILLELRAARERK